MRKKTRHKTINQRLVYQATQICGNKHCGRMWIVVVVAGGTRERRRTDTSLDAAASVALVGVTVPMTCRCRLDFQLAGGLAINSHSLGDIGRLCPTAHRGVECKLGQGNNFQGSGLGLFRLFFPRVS